MALARWTTTRSADGLFIEEGLEGLTRFEAGGSVGQLSGEQQDKLKACVGATLPGHKRQVGAYSEREFDAAYEPLWTDRASSTIGAY